jgi:hypothetical protein
MGSFGCYSAESSKVAIEWYEAKLQQTLLEIEDNFENTEFQMR